MRQFLWRVYQFAIGVAVYVYCVQELDGQGFAPVIAAFFASLAATVLLSAIFNLFRATMRWKRGIFSQQSRQNSPPISRGSGQ